MHDRVLMRVIELIHQLSWTFEQDFIPSDSRGDGISIVLGTQSEQGCEVLYKNTSDTHFIYLPILFISCPVHGLGID